MKLFMFKTCWACVLFFAIQHQIISQCIQTSNGLVQPDGTPCANTIITAVPFLRIVPDARFGAMGDVGIAMAPDPNSMHFNASNLVFSDKDLSVSLTYTPWLRALGLTDVFLGYLSSAIILENKKIKDPMLRRAQSLGMSLRFFSLGEIQYTDAQGNALQTVRPNEFELSVAYSRRLTKAFSTGLTIKYIFSSLGTGVTSGGEEMTPAHAFGADVSFTYRQAFKKMGKVGEGKDQRDKATISTGLVLSNLGSKISYTRQANRDYMPANLGIGTAFEYNFDAHNSLTVGFDINKLLVPTPVSPTIEDESGNAVSNPEYDADLDGEPDYKQMPVVSAIFSSFGDAPGGASEEFNELMLSLGLEYWYNRQFAVRAGYFYEHPTKGGRQFFTVGLGVRYNIFNLNFSYLIPSAGAQRHPLDNTLRFSLLFDFMRASKS